MREKSVENARINALNADGKEWLWQLKVLGSNNTKFLSYTIAI